MEENLDIYVVSFKGDHKFASIFLASDLIEAHDFLVNRMKSLFKEKVPDYEIIGPIPINGGYVFSYDNEGNIFVDTKFLADEESCNCQIDTDKDDDLDDVIII